MMTVVNRAVLLKDRLSRALVGRLCRYRAGRRVIGSRDTDAVRVGMLDLASLPAWTEYLRMPHGSVAAPAEGVYIAVAMARGKIIGHVSVFRQWETHPRVALPGWWLTGLEVSPRCRGTGIGRKLVEHVIEVWMGRNADEALHLVVNRRNGPAIRLFASCGFCVVRNEDWENRLARVYGSARDGRCRYSIMTREASVT